MNNWQYNYQPHEVDHINPSTIQQHQRNHGHEYHQGTTRNAIHQTRSHYDTDVNYSSAALINGRQNINNYYITQVENKNLNKTTNNANDLLFEKFGISQQKPKYAKYAVFDIRVSSYRGFPTEVSQTPESLAKAGFFFSGKDDVVFCFFCGQGLKSWEPNDDPWIEHARWAPKCHYLLNIKGVDFVNMVQIAHNDPEEAYPDKQEPMEVSVESKDRVCKSDIDSAGTSINKPDNDPVPRRLMGTIAAQSLLSNGYEYDKVKTAIQTFIDINGGNKEFTASDLLHTLFAIEDGTLKPSVPRHYDDVSDITCNASGQVDNVPRSNDDVSDINCNVKDQGVNSSKNATSDMPSIQTLRHENRQLKDQTLCKLCMEETVSVVFLPCGHLCSCTECAPTLGNCPICRAFIKGTVKTFLA